MNEYSEFSPGLPRQSDIGAAGAVPGSLAAIIGRIEEAVETETEAIRTDPAFDIKASNARKSRYLYELNRAMKAGRPEDSCE